jgi:hypothetical protein
MRGGNEEEQVRYTEGESVSEMGGRESRKGRYRNISSQIDGRRNGRREDRHDHGREKGRRNRGFDDMFRGGKEVQEYKSATKERREVGWLER